MLWWKNTDCHIIDECPMSMISDLLFENSFLKYCKFSHFWKNCILIFCLHYFKNYLTRDESWADIHEICRSGFFNRPCPTLINNPQFAYFWTSKNIFSISLINLLVGYLKMSLRKPTRFISCTDNHLLVQAVQMTFREILISTVFSTNSL